MNPPVLYFVVGKHVSTNTANQVFNRRFVVGREEKTPADIRTTDKLKIQKILAEAGYFVEMGNGSVPTVVCKKREDMSKDLAAIRKILKEQRYEGSFGVRAPRKTDEIQVTENEESSEMMDDMVAAAG